MSEWIRVTRQNRCTQCGHDTWCLLSSDGGTAICMRSVSDHPKTFKSGEVGYIHKLNGHRAPVPVKREQPKVEIDAEGMMKGWLKDTKAVYISRLADDLGVKASALLELGVCWAKEHYAFGFPMRDGLGSVVGIRLRNASGKKWSVRGSHAGIFLPYCKSDDTVWIVEGASDTAAALSIGLYAVGRPSCSGGLYHLKTLFDRLHIRRAVIIADNDKPGLEGAEQLVRHAQIPCCVMTLPCKDVREFTSFGGTSEMLEDMVKGFVWRNVTAASTPKSFGTPSPAEP